MLYNILPVPAPRMTRSDKWKKRPCVENYYAYCNQVRLIGIQLPIPSKVTFYLPMPASWSRKKRDEFADKPHMQKPDWDNLAKALCDAVNKDDSHIWGMWVEKRWSVMPGIRVQSIEDAIRELMG